MTVPGMAADGSWRHMNAAIRNGFAACIGRMAEWPGREMQGLAAACGEYITYVDSDDWLPENVLGQLERKADQTQADILLYDAWSVC